MQVMAISSNPRETAALWEISKQMEHLHCIGTTVQGAMFSWDVENDFQVAGVLKNTIRRDAPNSLVG